MICYYRKLFRPEGYIEDLKVVRGMTTEQAAKQFANLASGAESGWDFSTRWFDWSEPSKLLLRSVKVTDIVPVDLNTFLYLTENSLALFSTLAGMDQNI